MQLAWWALAGFLTLGIALGPLNNTCCLVGPGAQYSSVQSALDAAPSGSTVVVLGGIYRENVVIHKPLRLISVNYAPLLALLTPGNPLLQAADDQRPAVSIEAPNVTFQGFIVRGGQNGVWVQGQHDVRVLNNRILQNDDGIVLDQVQAVWVKNNRVSASQRAGIRVLSSQHVRLVDNNVERNATGIVLEDTQRSLVQNNTFRNHSTGALTLSNAAHNALLGNKILTPGPGLLLNNSPGSVLRGNRLPSGTDAFWVSGDTADAFTQSIGTSNTLGDLPILYLNGLKNRRLKPHLKVGFLALINAKNVTVSNLDMRELPLGALLVNAQHVAFRQSTFDQTRRGLWVIDSQDIVVTDSTISNSQDGALRFESSQDVRVERASISSSGGQGLYALGGGNITLKDSQISRGQASAVWFERVSSGLLLDNVFEHNAQYATLLKETQDVGVRGNRLDANQTGLYLEKAERNVIENNTIQNNQWGIFLLASSRNTIQQNTFGLNVRGSIRGLVDNNTIQDNVEQEQPAE